MEKEEVYEILEQAYFGENSDEQVELQKLRELIAGVDLFVDVGASLGPYTREASRLLDGADIIALEADPIRYERLCELAADWQKASPNTIKVVHCAVGQQEGTVSFISTESNVSGSLSPIEGRTAGGREITVSMKTLDDICAPYLAGKKRIFIKMDIEGGEYMALKGATNVLASENADFLIELHAWGDSTNKKYSYHCLALMKDNGYAFRKIGSHYQFSKRIGGSESDPYAYEITKSFLKANLRRVPLLRRIKRALLG